VPVTEESINELNGGHARSESPAVGRGHQSGLNSGAPVDSGVIVSVGNKLLLQSVVVFVGVDEGRFTARGSFATADASPRVKDGGARVLGSIATPESL